MLNLRRDRALVWIFAATLPISLGACTKSDEALSSAALDLIPADVHGVYGRTAEDAPGLKVTASGLEFRSMKMIIHEGKMEGSTVRVERATLAWEHLDPKTCTGTISRQGENLLLSLFDVNSPDAKCESILDTQWRHWVEVEALPELMQGRYGALLVEPRRMRFDIEWIHAELEVGTIWELPGTNDERAELLVNMAKISTEDDEGHETDYLCDGDLTLVEGELEWKFWIPATMVPAEGSDEAKDPELMAKVEVHREACERWKGAALKYEVNLEQLPKAPLSAGDVKLTVSPDKVVLDSPDLRCEQDLWETQTVENRAGWRGTQFGGERMALGRAVPSSISPDCKIKLRIFCEGEFGTNTADIDLDVDPDEAVAICLEQAEHNLCPEAITVREISNTRYKVNVEPMRFNQIACVDVTAEFSPGAKVP